MSAGFLKLQAGNLSVRTNRRIPANITYYLILRIIDLGSVSGLDCLHVMAQEDIDRIQDSVDKVPCCCYWTNLVLLFTSSAGFLHSLQTVLAHKIYRTMKKGKLLFALHYGHRGIRYSALLYLNLNVIYLRLFNDMSPEKRHRFLRLLIAKYNPQHADMFMNNYENGVDNGIVFSSKDRKYWSDKWTSHRKEARERFRNTPSELAKRGYAWKTI